MAAVLVAKRAGAGSERDRRTGKPPYTSTGVSACKSINHETFHVTEPPLTGRKHILFWYKKQYIETHRRVATLIKSSLGSL